MIRKRMLDCNASDYRGIQAEDLLHMIRANEGRTILVELKEDKTPHVPEITNSELARAAGADMILLNQVDVFNPQICALSEDPNPIRTLQNFVRRPMGVNLEPVQDNQAKAMEILDNLPLGRRCCQTSVEKVAELNLDFICLTGNPRSGVTNESIKEAIHLTKKHFSGIIIAGKMHAAAFDEPITSPEVVEDFIEAGADIILLPAIGTIPGFTFDDFQRCCQLIHQRGALCLAANGTSQDCSQKEVVVQIGLASKTAGADIQHTGSSGSGGIAPFENIVELSMAIRGLNHTLRRMAISNER